jgi:NADH-quinone oxidoreductase subunit N
MQSLALYVLVSSKRDDSKSTEAGVKYFVLGALASGMILYGISLLYGYTGTTEFAGVSEACLSYLRLPLPIIVGMICVLCGLFFKISAAPFHMWTPDVYEGAPMLITCALATLGKLVIVGITVRILYEVFGAYIFSWQQILFVVSAITMLWGALGACAQENIKRLLAYSSVGHMGFVLLGMFAGTQEAMIASLLYAAVYVMMSLGVFACLMRLERRGVPLLMLKDCAGLIRTRPWEASMLTLLFLSMAGIPPMAGFFIKLEVFKTVLAIGVWVLPLIGLLATVISAYYYLRFIKIMICDGMEDNPAIGVHGGPVLLWTGMIMTLVNLGYIFFPDLLLAWITQALI